MPLIKYAAILPRSLLEKSTDGPRCREICDRTKAEDAYSNLIHIVRRGIPATHMLCGDSEQALYYRGLLIDQSCDGASYADLWEVRIAPDIAWRRDVSLDLSTGRDLSTGGHGGVSRTANPTDKEVLTRLWNSLSLTLDYCYRVQRWRFALGDKPVCEGVVRALFKIPVNARDLHHRLIEFPVPPYETRKNLIELCIAQCNGPSARVTIAIALNAQHRISSLNSDPTGSERQTIDLAFYTRDFGNKLKKKLEDGGVVS
jgi:hypothetical protein